MLLSLGTTRILFAIQIALSVFVFSSSTRFTLDNTFALFAWFPLEVVLAINICGEETGPENLKARG